MQGAYVASGASYGPTETQAGRDFTSPPPYFLARGPTQIYATYFIGTNLFSQIRYVGPGTGAKDSVAHGCPQMPLPPKSIPGMDGA